jgi:hypothetical protein
MQGSNSGCLNRAERPGRHLSGVARAYRRAAAGGLLLPARGRGTVPAEERQEDNKAKQQGNECA